MATENTGLREKAVMGQVTMSEVCAACFSSSFRWPQEPLRPTWPQRLPCCPSLPRGWGVIWTPGNRGRLAGEGQGGYGVGDNDWLCLPKGLGVG